MTTPLEPTQERLQSYLDGELGEVARAEVERELESNTALRAELDALVELRRILHAAPDAFEGPYPGDLAFERVRQSIHDALKPTTGGQNTPAVAAPAKRGSKSASSRARRLFLGSFVAVAAAAAVFVVSFGVPSTSDQAALRRAASEAPRTATAAMNGTEIVRVEFGKMSGTYWEQTEGDERVAVVWIDDTFPEEVGRP